MNNLIYIENNNSEIVSTNYFRSRLAGAGLWYLSSNAGVFRVLVPKAFEKDLPELVCQHAIVSRGRNRAGIEEIELLFEDGADHPYSAYIGLSCLDRLPSPEDDGREDLRLSVWIERDGKPFKTLEIDARYREVVSIPCLKHWKRSR